jgi:hypothetical protein
MDAPGCYTLAALGLTTPLTSQAQTAIVDLSGMSAVSLEARFAYGSGGTTCIVVVQTSLDGGTNWIDVARFDFATASAVKTANLSAAQGQLVSSYAALAAQGLRSGVLGDRLRAVITSTGTFASTTVSVRAATR